MRRSPRILGIFAIMITVLSCSGEEIGQDNTSVVAEPKLKAITVNDAVIVLETGGSAEVNFNVTDADYQFSELLVQKADGSLPEFFEVSQFKKKDNNGNYTLTLTDKGIGEEYDESVSLAIVKTNAATGNKSYVSSNTFRVRSDGPETGGVIINTGLPTVYVNTQNGVGIYSKTEYVPASMSIKGTKNLPGLEAVSCNIRGRGNTTWTWPKKPYLIKLDSKTSVMGFPKHKRWVLLANFMDRTMMRNMVSMKVSSMMTNLAWTPRCQPVELVLNGEHKGCYLLIEQVRVDKNRVNISETDGYLFELDFHYDNPIQWKDHNIPFAIKYPDEDDITQAQIDYAKNYIAEVSNVLYGSGYQDHQNGYAKYLDVDSFIDYWIVFEVMGNHELGNPGSVYFHKDVNGKLTAGPCWDFDWGVLSFKTSPHAETGLVNGNAIWYKRLFQDPVFKNQVKERFNELLPQLKTIPDYMEECRTMLSASAELNFKLWNPADDKSQNGGSIINGDENMTFDAAVDLLKSNYNTHLQAIQSKL